MALQTCKCVPHTLTCMDLEKLKKFTVLRAIPDQLLYSLLIWPDHSIPASYGPVFGCTNPSIVVTHMLFLATLLDRWLLQAGDFVQHQYNWDSPYQDFILQLWNEATTGRALTKYTTNSIKFYHFYVASPKSTPWYLLGGTMLTPTRSPSVIHAVCYRWI